MNRSLVNALSISYYSYTLDLKNTPSPELCFAFSTSEHSIAGSMQITKPAVVEDLQSLADTWGVKEVSMV